MRRYRVEIYVSEGSVKSGEWVLKYKGSPGCLSQLEDVLGEGLGAADDTPPCLMAVNIKTDPVTKVIKAIFGYLPILLPYLTDWMEFERHTTDMVNRVDFRGGSARQDCFDAK